MGLGWGLEEPPGLGGTSRSSPFYLRRELSDLLLLSTANRRMPSGTAGPRAVLLFDTHEANGIPG